MKNHRWSFAAGVLCFLCASVLSAEPIQVGGFLDLQHQWRPGALELTSGTWTTPERSTFLLRDGAVYVGKKQGAYEAFVDIPFRTSVASGTTTNNFDLALTKAQAYVVWKSEPNRWGGVRELRLGQYDSPFGLEGVDTKDLLFSQQSFFWETLPTTHTGIHYKGWNDNYKNFTWALLYGNGQQKGQQPNNSDPEWGARLGWEGESFKVFLGYLSNKPHGTYTVGSENPTRRNENLVDLQFGYKGEQLTVDLGATQLTPAEGRVLENGQVKDKSDGLFLQGIVGWQSSSDWGASLRWSETTNVKDRYVTSAGLGGNGARNSQVTLGLRRSSDAEKKVTWKAEVSSTSLKVGANANQVSFLDGAIGAVFVF